MNIVEFLNSKQLTISSAESFTGGKFSSYITSFPNASKCFKGGITCYAAEVKNLILGVNQETIEKFGTISKECCTEMCEKCLKLFNTDIAVSFTGNAGPSASENKEVGLCYIGLATKEKTVVNELHLNGTREEIRDQAIKLICELLTIIL